MIGRAARIKSITVLIFILLLGLIQLRDSKGQDNSAETAASASGLKVTITGVVVGADRRPAVTFRLTDSSGAALDKDAPPRNGPVEMRFQLARIKSGETQYTSYITRTQSGSVSGSVQQAWSEGDGVFKLISAGTYTYTFKTSLPADFDPATTHTVGIGARRDLTQLDGHVYSGNATYDFLPAGGKATIIRDVVLTSNCNQCHDALTRHDGFYNDIKNCVICHTSQTLDPQTGNSLDMKVMVHKIHSGSDLPSVKAGRSYKLGTDAGVQLDFSGVKFPTDIRGCDVCHAGASQAANHLSQFSRAACASCHDDVNFDTGLNHLGGRQGSDRLCTLCHFAAQRSNEFDRLSTAGAHLVERNSSQALHPKFEITGLSNTGRGQKPVITFTIKDRKGTPIPPSAMDELAFVIAGPTTDYNRFIKDDQVRSTYSTTFTGAFQYTLKTAVPLDAQGTWAIGMEGYKKLSMIVGSRRVDVKDGGDNVVRYFSVTDFSAAPRRTLVDTAKCNVCHQRLTAHDATSNNNVAYCALCHNPTQTDASARPPGQGPADSVDFRVMIHKVHSGVDLAVQPYVLFGDGPGPGQGKPHEFGQIRFPADPANCAKCHVSDSWLPDRMPGGLLPTSLPRSLAGSALPVGAVCTSCHDKLNLSSHVPADCSACHAGYSHESSSCGTCHVADPHTSATCASCHTTMHDFNNCASCHSDIDKTVHVTQHCIDCHGNPPNGGDDGPPPTRNVGTSPPGMAGTAPRTATGPNGTGPTGNSSLPLGHPSLYGSGVPAGGLGGMKALPEGHPPISGKSGLSAGGPKQASRLPEGHPAITSGTVAAGDYAGKRSLPAGHPPLSGGGLAPSGRERFPFSRHGNFPPPLDRDAPPPLIVNDHPPVGTHACSDCHGAMHSNRSCTWCHKTNPHTSTTCTQCHTQPHTLTNCTDCHNAQPHNFSNCTSCHDGLQSTHARINPSATGEMCLVCHGEGKRMPVREAHARSMMVSH